MTNLSSLFRKVQKHLGATPKDQIENAAAGVYLLSGLVAVGSLLIDPPKKPNPEITAIENYSCPDGSRGPFQDLNKDTPYCENGPWFWPVLLDATDLRKSAPLAPTGPNS